MSTEEKPCASRAYVMDSLTTCDRPDGHGGVHVGRVLADGIGKSAVEVVQWTDADAASDTGSVDDVPIWYAVLPIGLQVRVGYRDDRDRVIGELTGAVLDDHEQLAALRLHSTEIGRHVLVPFHNLATLSWADDQ